MRFKRYQYLGFAFFLIFGLVLAAQFKNIYYTNKEKEKSSADTEYYTAQLQAEREKGSELRNELARLELELTKLTQDKLFSSEESALRAELRDTEFKAGLTDVKGAGITVTLNDSTTGNKELIHDLQMLMVVNELKIAGAQAISINGQRIMPFSENVCAGSKISINNFRYSVPYVITAIGNADALYNGLVNSLAYISIKAKGIIILPEKSKELTVPKYMGNVGGNISALTVPSPTPQPEVNIDEEVE